MPGIVKNNTQAASSNAPAPLSNYLGDFSDLQEILALPKVPGNYADYKQEGQSDIQYYYDAGDDEWLPRPSDFKGYFDSLADLKAAFPNPLTTWRASQESNRSQNYVVYLGEWIDEPLTLDGAYVETYVDRELSNTVKKTGEISQVIEGTVSVEAVTGTAEMQVKSRDGNAIVRIEDGLGRYTLFQRRGNIDSQLRIVQNGATVAAMLDDGSLALNGANVPTEKLDVCGNVKATAFLGDGSQLTGISAALNVQDANGITQFSGDSVKFEGVSFDIPNKKITAVGSVPNVIFLSNIKGNDSTAENESLGRPYKTLNAAMTAYLADTTIEKIEIIDNSSYVLSVRTDLTNRNIQINSQNNSPTINLEPTSKFNTLGYDFNINAPSATVNFTNGYNPGNQSRTIFNCRAANFTISNNSSLGYNNRLDFIIGGTFTANTVQMDTTAYGDFNRLQAKNIVMVNSTIGSARSWIFDWDLLTAWGTCDISSKGTTEVSHGSVNGSGTLTFITPETLNITYKNGAKITSGYTINCFNAVNAKIKLVGEADLTGRNIITHSNKAITNVLTLVNANIKCNRLATDRFTSSILLDNSTVALGDMLVYSNEAVAVGVPTFPNPALKIKGFCFITTPTDGSDLFVINTATTARPVIDINEGILYTNAKFNRAKFDILEKPFNQYYETSKKNELIVSDKYQIINQPLSATTSYIIDGNITLTAGEYIYLTDVNSSLTINGYGLELSQIKKNVSGEAIFIKDPSLTDSGGLQMFSLKLSTPQSQVFNIKNIAGNDAIELNVINFEECLKIGTLDNYRQFLGTTLGIYGCSDGFELLGSWSGFKITNTNCFGFGSAGTLFKAGLGLIFSSRFFLELNAAFPTGAVLSDFTTSNFSSENLFQIKDGQYTLSTTSDPLTNTSLLLPNITPKDTKCLWEQNVGIQDSYKEFVRIKGEDNLFYELFVDATGTLTTRTV